MSLCSVSPSPAALTPDSCTSSPITRLYRKSSTPPPPCSSGTAIPRNPCAPAAANTSRGTIPDSSHSRWCGTTSLSSHRRKLARNSSCSNSNSVRCMGARYDQGHKQSDLGELGTAGLRGWPPRQRSQAPPTHEPELGNASGGRRVHLDANRDRRRPG